jgi:hypothetical protein
MSSEEPQSLSNYRSITSLYIRVLVTTIFAVTTYIVLQRHLRKSRNILLVILYPCIPTLPLIQLGVNIIRSVKHYLLHHDVDAPCPVLYYIHGCLGTHVLVNPKSDLPTTSHTAATPSSQTMPILDIHPSILISSRTKISVSFLGRLFTVLFALIQASGTFVLYIRRTENSGRYWVSYLDHRIGWLAASSAVCSIANLLSLLTRTEYSVDEDSLAEEDRTASTSSLDLQKLASEVGVALFLHGILEYTILEEDNKPTFRTVSFLYEPLQAQIVFIGMFILLLRIFRREIRRLSFISAGSPTSIWISRFQLKKLKSLLLLCMIIWILIDVLWVFILDIRQPVQWWADLKTCIARNDPGERWNPPRTRLEWEKNHESPMPYCRDVYLFWWSDVEDGGWITI